MSVQVLLKEDVDATGKKGEIVKVRPGFARNYLLPQGKALVADKNALRMQERLREERLKQAAVDKKDSEAIAAKLVKIELATTVKVDKSGHLYGSVSAADLYSLLESTHGIILGKRDIQLKHPIKKLGTHTIHCKLKEDVPATFKVKVEGEGYTPPPEAVLTEEAPKAEAPKEE